MPRLVDADKLRKDILDLPNCYNGFSDAYDKAYIIDVIDEQPTVNVCPYWDNESDYCALNKPADAEPAKRGRWIKVEDDYNNHLYECSYCHTLTSLPTEEDNDPHIRYCWSCGAKMDR